MNAAFAPAERLKILLLEDSPTDAELVLHALRTLPVPVEHLRVEDEHGLRKGLAEFVPHVVLSDFSMPNFSGQEALEIVREKLPHVPFLYVSGTIGEELAIDALHRGAMDYVLKDNLRRLASAVERAIEIAGQRSERIRIEQALRESEERFRTIVESSQDWIWESDPNTRITYSNGAIAQVLGYQPGEIVGSLAVDHMLAADREQVLRKIPQRVAVGRGWERWRLQWRHREGGIRTLESTATARFDDEDRLIGYRGVDHDITEQLRQETSIRRLARVHAVLAALGNVILRTRARAELLGQVCTVAVEQGAFEAACLAVPAGNDGLELVGSHGNRAIVRLLEPQRERSLEPSLTALPQLLLRPFNEKSNIVFRDIAGSDLPLQNRLDMGAVGIAALIALPVGSPPWGVLGLFASRPQEFDPEEVALLERLAGEVDYALDFITKSERLEYMAYHNPVTGLPNRTAFRQHVDARLADGPLAVAMVDLANFGRINASRGRPFGDRLLYIVGQRLKAMAGSDALVAHAGEDAFLLGWVATRRVEDEIERLEQLLRPLDELPCEIDDERVMLHFNGGLALGPEHGADYETLEHSAAAALGEAVRRKVRVESFSDRLRQRTTQRIEVERNVHRALEENQFELFYQPKFDATNRSLIGAEALLRWRHPQSGLMAPAEFIPVLEETGLIVEAGRWIMRTALETALAWRTRGHPRLRVAVNVSARELRNLRFLDGCRELLEPHAADQPLDIEITESLLMDDIEHSVGLLQSLRALGCQISIDDFGTGYSSLSYLARLPVDVIKIDQSFVAQIAHSPEAMSLITNTITLVHSLSLRVVAEGVEDEEQVKLLRLLRCDELQGYLLGRPMPVADFVTRLL